MVKKTNNADKFIEKISKDVNLRKQVANLYKMNAHKEIEKLAAAAGFPCAYKELVESFKKHGLHGKELSDKDLKLLAAGKSHGGDQDYGY